MDDSIVVINNIVIDWNVNYGEGEDEEQPGDDGDVKNASAGGGTAIFGVRGDVTVIRAR